MKKVKEKYPSAVMLMDSCYEDYNRLISTYDKIYDKVNIALAFCGIMLIVIVDKLDYRILIELFNEKDPGRFFFLLLFSIAMFISGICIIISVIKLLSLMRSKSLQVFDSIAIRNDKIYEFENDEAALWIIDKYTIIVSSLRDSVMSKQKQFDKAVIITIISILAYLVLIIIEKGL